MYQHVRGATGSALVQDIGKDVSGHRELVRMLTWADVEAAGSHSGGHGRGLTQAQAARRYRVSESFVSRLLARWRLEGENAFEPRSRRPHRSPTAIDPAGKGLDACPATIAWHLDVVGITVSAATIRRRLLAAGLTVAEPKKRPRSPYVRFQADLPNECWQSDFAHWRLADGTDSEILTWLDDHARYALSVTAHRHVTGAIVVTTFQDTATELGLSGIGS